MITSHLVYLSVVNQNVQAWYTSSQALDGVAKEGVNNQLCTPKLRLSETYSMGFDIYILISYYHTDKDTNFSESSVVSMHAIII